MYANPLRSRLSSLLLFVPLMAVAAPAAHAETTGWETDGWNDPTIDIISPADSAHFGPGPVDVPVEVASTFDGLSAPTVHLKVDGMLLPESCGAAPICMFTVPLEDGEHVLLAQIHDDGIPVQIALLTVFVGEEACDTGAATSGPGAGSGGATSGADCGGGDGLGGGDEPSKGCSVSTGASTPAMAGAFFLLGLGALGRRRRR